MSVNVCPHDIFFNHRTFCYQRWHGDAASWARVSCRKKIFCFFGVMLRSRSQWWFIWSKYDCFYYIFWTVDSFATKLGLMIHHHKPEYPVKEVGLLHSGSKSQGRVKILMFVQISSSEPPAFCFQTRYCDASICKSLCDQNMTMSIFWTADLFAARLCLIVHCHKRECFMEKLDSCVQGQGHS